jgi:mevalonate kinase
MFFGDFDLKAVASAPAKVILTGEHFVVYGEPAIAMAVDCCAYVTVEGLQDNIISITSDRGFSEIRKEQRSEAEADIGGARKILEPIRIASLTALKEVGKSSGLKIEIASKIPIAAGMGSSGALAVATIAAVGKLFGVDFTKEELIDLSFEAERFVHGTPSGIDQTISAYGGIIMYRKNEGITPLKTEADIPIVIGNTEIPRVTGDLVKAVSLRRDRFPEMMGALIKTAGRLSSKAAEALRNGDLHQLGELMNINHGLLTAVGVSNEALDRLVYAAIRAGALGAKLTGAGGGGCMIALSTIGKRREIAGAIRKAGGTPIIAKKTDEGVKVWIEEQR